MTGRGERVLVELRVPPQWARIDKVSRAIGDCVAAVFEGLDIRDALRIAASELLENAIKYGKPGSPVRIVIYDSPQEITLEVSNVIGEETDRERLEAKVAWIAQFASSEDAYREALLDAAGRAERGERGGGLGLVRVVYEGGASLGLGFETAGSITVRARVALEGALAAG